MTVRARCDDDATNVGRESGAFFEHIVENYDALAEWTVFSQAHAPS